MSRMAIAAALLFAALQTAAVDAATFLFVRHAESKANDGSATTVEEIVNPPLTARGEQQAIDLVDVLKGRDVTTIYTSAYQRTQQTIAPTAAYFGLPTTADARTNEWYWGDMTEGSTIDYSEFLRVMGAWAAGDTAAKMDLPNAESLDDMVARVVPAWEEIIAAHKDDDGVVLLVGHGLEIGFVMPFFAQNVSLGYAAGHGLHNTGIVELKLFGDKPYVTNWQGEALAVPEPASWAMLIIGFGFIGAAMRRRSTAAGRA